MGAPMYVGTHVVVHVLLCVYIFSHSLHLACFLPSPPVLHRVGLAHSFCLHISFFIVVPKLDYCYVSWP